MTVACPQLNDAEIAALVARNDRPVPARCEEWYCERRPAVLTADGDFLCKQHYEAQTEGSRR